MAAAEVAEKTLVRCPVCLMRLAVAPDTTPGDRLTCPGCGKSFANRDALSVAEPASAEMVRSTVEAKRGDASHRFSGKWALLFAVLAAASRPSSHETSILCATEWGTTSQPIRYDEEHLRGMAHQVL